MHGNPSNKKPTEQKAFNTDDQRGRGHHTVT